LCTAVYSVRSPDPMRVKELMIKLENCFRGAAIATSTEVTIKWTRTLRVGDGNKIAGLNVHSNEKMAQRFKEYVSQDGTQFSLDGGVLANASTVRSCNTKNLISGLRRSNICRAGNSSNL
jgi:metal-dependent amidase/aminoacylase/carboxypeptidase family protein